MNVVDYIQVISNEFLKPGNSILISGNGPTQIKYIFNFINCNFIIINSNDNESITVKKYLPFEENTFDLILDFDGNTNFKNVLKKTGKQFTLV